MLIADDILWGVAPSVVTAAVLLGGLKVAVNGSAKAIHRIDDKTDKMLSNQAEIREDVAHHSARLDSHDQRFDQLDAAIYARRRND